MSRFLKIAFRWSCTLFITSAAFAQTPPPIAALRPVIVAQTPIANPADVRTIGDIVRASYEAINGPAGAERQWQRNSTLYMPTATFVFARDQAGTVQTTTKTLDDFQRRIKSPAFVARGGFETEIGRRIERFGNVAQVRSVSMVRFTPNGPIKGRFVNYLQLYWDGVRWWIAGMVFDKERPNAPIPSEWIGTIDSGGR